VLLFSFYDIITFHLYWGVRGAASARKRASQIKKVWNGLARSAAAGKAIPHLRGKGGQGHSSQILTNFVAWLAASCYNRA